MKTPLKITYRHVPPSPALTNLINQEVAQLEDLGGEIIQGRVVVDEPNLHHRRKHFQVEILLFLPGLELISTHHPEGARDGDAYSVVEHGFDSVRRQLKAYLRRQGGHGRERLTADWA